MTISRSTPRVRFLAGVLAPAILASAVAVTPTAAVAQPSRDVRFVYLVPADRVAVPCYADAIEHAARHLRAWYQQEMGNGRTFSLASPVVDVVSTPHPASWYSTNPNGGSTVWFWNNVLQDAFEVTNGEFDDRRYRWIYYIDADPACGQIGGGGTNGVAVLPANDLRGLTGQKNVPACPNEPPDGGGVCRWIGGAGHEVGHALGLPHPIGCEDGNPDTPCIHNALMWLGYLTYPDAVLLPEDRAILNQSDFFTVQQALPAPGECASATFPRIVSPPVGRAIRANLSAVLSVSVTGTEPITYQWRKQGIALIDSDRFTGTGSPTLTIDPTDRSDTGDYDVVVSTSCGTVTTEPAGLNVVCPVDWNADLVINSQDFFDFLDDFFVGEADFNDDGTTNSQDFFDFLNGFFEGCADGPEVAITAVSVPPHTFCGGIATAVSVTFTNSSPSPANVPVRIRLGSSEALTWVTLHGAPWPPETVQIPITTPACTASCGQTTTSLEAVVAIMDGDASDNRLVVDVAMWARYWDLHYSIDLDRSSAALCSGIRYTVIVTNQGTIRSPVVCSRTGICLTSSCGTCWTNCIGNVPGCNQPSPIEFDVGRLDPGESAMFEFPYNICCNACVGRQYVKAGPNRCDSCSTNDDPCPAGNCASEPICIGVSAPCAPTGCD
jgi:hypothetical protein